jgi:leader peptidase (prepilin peptidase) / N-methyltransferase
VQGTGDDEPPAPPALAHRIGARREMVAAASAFLLLYAVVAVPSLWAPSAPGGFLPASLLLAVALAALSAIDLYEQRLPDLITLPLAALGLAVSAWSGIVPAWWPLASAALGFALLAGLAHLYRHIRGRDGLGLGDAKLMGAAGAWLGAQAIATVLLWATAAALLCILAAYARGRALSGTTRLPFGPFLAFAIWAVWLYGPV